MGNFSKNVLLIYQVEFLYSLVRQVAGNNIVLWVDPLFVLIDPETNRLTILKLRKVYEKANKVLVINRDLMKIRSNQTEQTLQLLYFE
jgi:hypothetical protein